MGQHSGYLVPALAPEARATARREMAALATTSAAVSDAYCQGYPKPSYQSGTALPMDRRFTGRRPMGCATFPTWRCLPRTEFGDTSRRFAGPTRAKLRVERHPAAGRRAHGLDLAGRRLRSRHGGHSGARQSARPAKPGAIPIPSTTRSRKTSTARPAGPSWAAAVTPAALAAQPADALSMT